MPASSGGVLFTLLFLLGVTSHGYGQEIRQAPESTVFFLDQSAVFTCETVGGALSWVVNGTQREVLALDDLVISETLNDGGSTVETLTIPARAEYNGTRVQCLVFSLSGSDLSENATMIIQGPPSAVDLKATSNATSITISWEAPWSLDVTGVDHDIWYSVLIQNVTDENNPTPISCTDCTNITETVYTFNLSPCLVYNFSVTPFNGAGQGESDNVTFAIAVPDTTFGEPSIKARNDGNCDVIFQVSGNLAQVCSIALRDEKGEEYVAEILEDQAMFLLPANKTYGNVSEVSTGGGVKNTTLTKILTTFDVQDPHAEPMGDGQINVTGSFINDTRAFGCFIAIQCNVTTEITFIALRRNGEQRVSEVIPMPPSNYTIHAYDLEEGAQLNTWPANPDPGNVSMIQVNGANSKPKNEENLRNGSISHTGSSVVITCAPKEKNASCLVVYRAHGNSTLNVISNKTISVMVNLTNGNYTFAIFRTMNEDSIDRDPFISRMVTVGGPSTTSPTTTDDDKGGSPSSSDVTGVVAGISVVIILVVATGIIVVVVVMWRQKKTRSRKPCPSSAVVPSASCTSFTKRSDEESGYWAQNGSSTIIPHGSATQAEEKEGKYAVVVTSSSGNRFPHSVDPTAVEYAKLDIRATHKMARFDYADVAPSPGNRPVIHDAKTECPYVDVKLPNPTTPVTSPSEEKTTEKTAGEKAKSQGPPTVEAVMSLIYCVAGRWKMIASGLGFDEDLIDEIDTNNVTDEACLQDCVEQWVSRLEPSWERLSHVLRDLGEERLAQQAWNGVSAEKGTECSECSEESYGEGSHEVVTGARGDTPFSDTRNDATRGGKIHSFGHFIVSFGDSTIREDQRKQEHTQSEDMGGVTNLSVEIQDFIEDDADLFGSPVIEECPENQDFSVCPGHQNSSPAPHTAKDPERNVPAGGVEVAPQQCSCVTPFPVQMEQDTATDGPFQHGFNESKGVERNVFAGDAEELPFEMVNCAQCTDMFPDARKHFSLDVQCERGTLLVGGKCNYTSSCQKPLSMVPEYLPFPGELSPEPTPPQEPAEVAVGELSPEPTPPQQPAQVAVEELSPEPTPPQEPAQVAVEEMGENCHPPTQPPTLPPSSRMELKATKNNNTLPFLDPPENFKEKVVKWLYTGVALGFHGPGSLFKLL